MIWRLLLSRSRSAVAVIAAALVIPLSAPKAFAENWVGISAFGIQSRNFQDKPCTELLAMMQAAENPAIAILFNTFGTDNTCLERFWAQAAEQGKKHLTEIHFSNEAGRRSGNLDENDFLGRYSPEEYNELLETMPKWLEARIRRRIGNILQVIEGQEDSGYFILSTGLEDNFSTLAWENLYRIFLEEWPSVIARNPSFEATFFKANWTPPEGVFMELHGYHRKLAPRWGRCIANGDGHDVDFLKDSGVWLRSSPPASLKDVETWIARAHEMKCITLFWTAKWQGIVSDRENSKPLSREFDFDRQDRAFMRELIEVAQTGEGLDPSASRRRRARAPSRR